MSDNTETYIQVEKHDRHAVVWLARPEKRNALNTTLFKQLVAALDALEEDDDVRCLVLAGQGPVFCAGQDLAFTRSATAREVDEYGRWNVAARQRLQRHQKAVVARVHGDAIGGGAYLATACDLVVAANGARFVMAEIQAGNHSGGSHLLTVGRARSLEMSLLGRPVIAEEAERWGLINRAVPPEDLDAVVDDYAGQLSALPPLAIRYTKQAMNLHLDMAGFTNLLDAGGVMQRYLGVTEDSREAKRSFVEKRPPDFTGTLPEPPER